MSRFPSLVMLMVLVFTGCASNHYAANNGGRVDLYLNYEGAREVLFASSADDFHLHRLHQRGRHLWVMKDLANREFKYFYFVDESFYLPDCLYREADDFGRQNCIYQPPREMQ